MTPIKADPPDQRNPWPMWTAIVATAALFISILMHARAVAGDFVTQAEYHEDQRQISLQLEALNSELRELNRYLREHPR